MVLVATYGLHLWYLQGGCLKGVTKQLATVQCLVVLWIMGCFKTSPVSGMEALAGLLPMHILLKRLVECSCAHTATLGHSRPVWVILGDPWTGSTPLAPSGLGELSITVKCHLVSPVKDTIKGCAEFMEKFQALHPEAEPANRVVDIFPTCIVQHLTPKMSDN